MSEERARLYFMCGKMAAGKSTVARELAREKNTVLLDQDEFLDALFPGKIRTIQDFAKYSARLRDGLSLHIRDLLSRGVSVVLDFPGNTRAQRQWFRELFEGASVEHELHFIDSRDDLCKRRLRQRSEGLPAGSAWTTDAASLTGGPGCWDATNAIIVEIRATSRPDRQRARGSLGVPRSSTSCAATPDELDQ